MNRSAISNAVSRFTDEVRSARQVFGKLAQCEILGLSEEYEGEHKDEFVWHLELLGRRLPILLDLIGMSDTREVFLASWEGVSGDLGVVETRFDYWDGPYLESKPFQVISDIAQVLGSLVPTEKQQGVAAQIEILEYVLRSIPQILRTREVVPRREADIQVPLHEHLESTFPDYNRRIRLPKGMKSFEPDGAIPSLNTLIELKFVDSEKKAKTALSGVKEDLSGYGGSRDWTRFYSTIYQTRAFVNETRFHQSLRLSGNAEGWRVIVVTGGGRGNRGAAQKTQAAVK